MKLNSSPNHVQPQRAAFTLIEMIGVLAVIAILAALLIPKVFSAINDARINNAVVSCETVKTAIADHYGKAGKFDAHIDGTPITPFTVPYVGYDTNVLLAESLLDKPFLTKIGTNSTIQVRSCELSSVAPSESNAAYALGGVVTTNDASGTYVLEAIINGVSAADARDVSLRIDGPTMSQTDITKSDIAGRVKYNTPSSGQVTTLYIYLTHR
jgi:prepilin-type N-terminal cleavage/methylation domain-containing protein